MIDEEATFKKYGYYARDLKPKSNKKIVVVCDECGKVRDVYKWAYSALCKSCSQKGNRNHQFGKSISEETRKKLSTSSRGRQYSKEQKKKRSDATKGENNPNYKNAEIEKRCLICGKVFFVYACNIRKGGGKYCSYVCAGKARHGINNPLWMGGVSFEPYCEKFNEAFKQYIRDKFDNVCFLCGKTEEENGQKLSVHHVSYNKACGCAETEEEKKADDKSCQFVPLCISCNSKVNGNRDYWEQYFKNKLQNKLNGWYI